MTDSNIGDRAFPGVLGDMAEAALIPAIASVRALGWIPPEEVTAAIAKDRRRTLAGLLASAKQAAVTMTTSGGDTPVQALPFDVLCRLLTPADATDARAEDRPVNTNPPSCEHRYAGTGCSARAVYRVSRGRKHDAQDSCRRHLAVTVITLEEGEQRPVTVEVLRGRS